MKIFNSSVKKVVWASLAATVVALPLRAQYVSTLISSGLNEPSAITADADGNAYIADSGNNRIDVFNPATATLSVLAGSGVEGTNNGSGGAEFFNPTGIVFTRGGLVVVDQGNQLIRFVTVSGEVSTLAGVYSPLGGDVDGPAGQAQFRFPTSVAADAVGNLYIADSGNNAIRLIDTNNVVHTVQIVNYEFNYPEGLTLDASNNLWVSDTLNDTIVVVSNIANISSQSATLIGGLSGVSGTNDALIATNARFNLPSGLYWDPNINALLVADTGNDTIRSILLTNGTGTLRWATRTIAGTPLQAGLQNGAPLQALFSQPAAIAADPNDAGLYVVDSANSAVRVFLPTPPQAQVSAPVFGFVTFPLEGSPAVPESQFNSSSNALFNTFNPPILAIQTEAGTATYITYGPTPTDPLNSTIPLPSSTTGQSPEVYQGDGLTPAESAPSIISPQPDVTIYAISEAPGRKSSPVVSARFQFVCANPVINGGNAASLQLNDATTGSEMFYTLDGSIPTEDGSNTNSVGPIGPGQTISINLVSNVVMSVRDFLNGFAPSGVSTVDLSVTNFVANQLTFGFPTGEEGSSAFIAAAGQRYVAPITLTLLPGAEMYSLQFNVTVTNAGSAPAPGATFAFETMLRKPDPNMPGFYDPIPPLMFANPGFTNGVFTNTSNNLLGVGWLERTLYTNLYNTLDQDLIQYSQAKDDLFLQSGGKVIVGGYSFVVPPTAQNGQIYRIQLGRPSATADGVGVTPTLVVAPTNGATGAGTINSIKNVVVGSARYIVGDVNDFRWFNAGDFGDGNLDNSDVEQVFETGVYGVNGPQASDLFDAMDSSNASTNEYAEIFTGTGAAANAVIDSMTYGDGKLNISDVYVTYRRSLDPSLTWYVRYWSNGVLNVASTSNAPQKTLVKPPVKTGISLPHTITVGVDEVVAANGTAIVPVRVLAGDQTGLPVSALMFDVVVQPLDGSPVLTTPVSLTPSGSLGTPTTEMSQGPQDYAAAWLGTTTGITGAGVIGNVVVSLPQGVGPSSAYRIVITNFSASPNGLGVYQATVQNGLVTVSDRSASSWGDGISDAWRLLHFGTITDPDSAANLDPDGDGASNWQEYLAGTDPLSAASVFKLASLATGGSASFSLQWQTVVGKHYTLESSPTAAPGSWTTLLNGVAGTGNAMSWTDAGGAQAKFFRAVGQ